MKHIFLLFKGYVLGLKLAFKFLNFKAKNYFSNWRTKLRPPFRFKVDPKGEVCFVRSLDLVIMVSLLPGEFRVGSGPGHHSLLQKCRLASAGGSNTTLCALPAVKALIRH